MKNAAKNSSEYFKYIVRVVLTNKPIYVTSSLEDAKIFASKNRKKLWIEERKLP